MSNLPLDILQEKLARLQKNRARLAQDRDSNQRILDNCNAALDLVDEDIFDLKAAIETLGGSPDETIPG